VIINPTVTITEIDNRDPAASLLRAGFSPITIPTTDIKDSLPYNKLDWRSFERLCYQILLAEGEIPHLFGDFGSRQYGIDIIMLKEKDNIVYQCKNVESVREGDLREILEKFEKDWLNDRPHLPTPKKFVLCIPLSLTKGNLKDEWLELKRSFYDSTGIVVDEWDLEYLNSRLRKLPDVVADLFSGAMAERFCDLPNWHQDIFRPVKPGSGDFDIKKYLKLKDAGHLYIDAKLRESFAEKLAIDGSLLIQGLPGSGKSLTCLALSEDLNQGRFRVFFSNLRHDVNENALFEGIKDRLSRPTVFLLDNCQGKYELLENLYERLTALELLGRHRLIFISRTSSAGKDLPLKVTDSFAEIMKDKATLLTFQPTRELFQNVIALSKPRLTALSATSLDKIYDIAAHDLFLLDQLLDIIHTAEDVDQLEMEKVYRATLNRYFRGEAVSSPYFMNLSALCQYDLAPPIDCIKKPQLSDNNEKEARTQLVIEGDSPLRHYFIHSSAAELIYRALIFSEKIENYHTETVSYLIDYFKRLISYFSIRKDGNQTVADELNAVLRNRLKLEQTKIEEDDLKGRFLGSDEIYAFIDKNFARFTLVSMVLALTVLKGTNDKTYRRYCDLFEEKINDGSVLSTVIGEGNAQSLKYIKTEFPQQYIILCTQFCEGGLSSLIQFKEIRGVMRFFSAFSAVLEKDVLISSILATSDVDWQNMIQRTIDSGRSIGTIPFIFRELKKADEDLLKQLERKIGTGYLKLAAGLGTMRVLQTLIQYMTFDFTKTMTAYAMTFSPSVWEGLIDRGDFRALAAFTRWALPHFRDLFNRPLLDELCPCLEDLVSRAPWSMLYQGAVWLEKSPDSLLKDELQKLLKKRVQETYIQKSKFESYTEAANYLGLLSLRAWGRTAKLDSLFEILPDEATWYDENFIRSARTFFFALAVSDVRSEDFTRVLNDGNNESVAGLFSQAGALDLLLYLWNLYSLRGEVKLKQPEEHQGGFKDFLDPAMAAAARESALKRLHDLTKRDGSYKEFIFDDDESELSDSKIAKFEMENLIALIGFLSSWGLISLDNKEKEKICASLSLDKVLRSTERKKSFLVAAFYLLGLDWLSRGQEKVITGELIKNVLSKKANYAPPVSKAMESLYNAIYHRYETLILKAD
jgi:DNA polymerase III delta prime subunit